MLYLEKNFHDINESNEKGNDKDDLKKKLAKIACDSGIWISSAIFEFITVMIFLGFVMKIDEHIQKQIRTDREIYGYPESHFDKIK